MEIPSWFGVNEYYWLLRTIIIVALVWMVGQLARANIVKTSKDIYSKIRSYFKKRKEEKAYVM